MTKEILLVDDDPMMLDLLSGILADVACTHGASDAKAAIDYAIEAKPDLILLDVDMPNVNGFDLCRLLKSYEELAEVPVIFHTAHGGEDFEVKAFACGANDFVAKPASEVVLKARINTHLQLRRLTSNLRTQALSDELTGLANRRHFESTLDREWRRAARNGAPISLLMIDVDHFKAYNDRYGHPAGDACLRRVSNALSRTLRRPCDFVARVGGEEFAALLPETARDGAMHVARAMVDTVAALGLQHVTPSGRSCVTVSIGVGSCEMPRDGADGNCHAPPGPGDLFARADSALYDAKRAGRACIRASKSLGWSPTTLNAKAARLRPAASEAAWHPLKRLPVNSPPGAA